MMLGRHATEAQILEVRHQLHLDLPLWQQYLEYLKQIVTFDYGRSYATKQPISRMIKDGIGPSLTLTMPAFFITTLLAVSIGDCWSRISAARRSTRSR